MPDVPKWRLTLSVMSISWAPDRRPAAAFPRSPGFVVESKGGQGDSQQLLPVQAVDLKGPKRRQQRHGGVQPHGQAQGDAPGANPFIRRASPLGGDLQRSSAPGRPGCPGQGRIGHPRVRGSDVASPKVGGGTQHQPWANVRHWPSYTWSVPDSARPALAQAPASLPRQADAEAEGTVCRQPAPAAPHQRQQLR